MGTLFGFVVGYVVGARAGSRGFDEVVEALRDVRDSDEFRAFVDVIRHHARSTAAQVSDRLSGRSQADDLIARANARMSSN